MYQHHNTPFYCVQFYVCVLLKINLKIKDTLVLLEPLKTIMNIIEKSGMVVLTYKPSSQEAEAWGCSDGWVVKNTCCSFLQGTGVQFLVLT